MAITQSPLSPARVASGSDASSSPSGLSRARLRTGSMPTTRASTCSWLSVTTYTRSAPTTTLAVVSTPSVDTATPEPTRLSVRRG